MIDNARLTRPTHRLQRINLVQIGIGLIGRTTITQILEVQSLWRERLGLDVVYRGLIGSDGAVACGDPDGYSAATLNRIIAGRADGRRLPDLAAEIGLTVRSAEEALDLALGHGPSIVLDTAAGDRSAPLAARALVSGAGLVFSNKAPLALPGESTEGTAIWNAARPGGQARYETSCGAGLPVISTLRNLLDTGDQPIEITGALSGTLGAIFSDVANGLPFSAAVRSAKEHGYTEPDPRDDLSGLDVARKALILARTLGRTIDLSELEIENLVPASLRSLPVEAFLDQVRDLDGDIAARSAAAKADGKTLKYVATIRPDGPIAVGVRPIGTETVLGALQGPENIVSFRTARYDAYPLNVTGPGAGAAVTAAGVLGDIIALAMGPQANTD